MHEGTYFHLQPNFLTSVDFHPFLHPWHRYPILMKTLASVRLLLERPNLYRFVRDYGDRANSMNILYGNGEQPLTNLQFIHYFSNKDGYFLDQKINASMIVNFELTPLGRRRHHVVEALTSLCLYFEKPNNHDQEKESIEIPLQIDGLRLYPTNCIHPVSYQLYINAEKEMRQTTKPEQTEMYYKDAKNQTGSITLRRFIKIWHRYNSINDLPPQALAPVFDRGV